MIKTRVHPKAAGDAGSEKWKERENQRERERERKKESQGSREMELGKDSSHSFGKGNLFFATLAINLATAVFM